MVCVSCLRQQMRQPAQRASYAHLRDDPYFFWYFHDDSWLADPYGSDDYALFESDTQELGTDVADSWSGS
jgi:hypothetical protein